MLPALISCAEHLLLRRWQPRRRYQRRIDDNLALQSWTAAGRRMVAVWLRRTYHGKRSDRRCYARVVQGYQDCVVHNMERIDKMKAVRTEDPCCFVCLGRGPADFEPSLGSHRQSPFISVCAISTYLILACPVYGTWRLKSCNMHTSNANTRFKGSFRPYALASSL